ncbi:MAG TPA: ComEC/Rec2 family competence protein [Pyrinomonadaceae bacterium]|nr:ComEC/Rec2 family competence protein [Pyrinomonadaceae bacterium]
MKAKSRQQAFMFPLAVLAAAFAVGMLPVLTSSLNVSLRGIVLAAVLCASISIVLLLKRSRRLAGLLVVLAFMFSGAALATIDHTTDRASVKYLIESGAIKSGQPVEITGVLSREPETARDRQYLTLRVERVTSSGWNREARGVVALLVPVSQKTKEELDQLDLEYGARVRVMTTLDREEEFRNPGVSPFTEYLDRKGYDAMAFVKSPLLFERLDNERIFYPLALLYKWRSRLQAGIDQHLSRETAGVLDAALLGNRFNLSQASAERFREGGTFHVLVISGLHITFLGALVFFIARSLTRNRLLQFLSSAAVVWGYSIAVGAEASVMRAALMFTVVLLAPLVSRRATSLNALGGVALVWLALRPGDLLDPAFQLTYISVLAIVVLAWPLIEKMKAIGSWHPTRETPYPPSCALWLRGLSEALFWSERKAKAELDLHNHSYRLFKSPFAEVLKRMHVQWLLRYIFAAVVVSLSVQLMLLPFLVVYFHRLSYASFLLNIAVSFLMAGVALTAIAGLLVAQISIAFATPLLRVADMLNWVMVHSVDPFESAGLASLRLPEYTGWTASVYALYYVPLAMLVVGLFRWQPLQLPKRNPRQGRRRLAWALVSFSQIVIVLLVILHPFSAANAGGKLRIDFLDVGQGDAALITLPNSTRILVDGGGQPGPFATGVKTEDGENVANDTRSIGEAVVSEYLWWRGLDHVDYLVATHGDADHIDGLNAVAKNFGVKAVFVGRTPGRDPEFAELSRTLSSENIPLRLIACGDELRIDHVSINVLHPCPAASSDLPSGNNESLVLQVRYGNRSVLMTADIEAPAEKSLLRKSTDLTADVVKVAHHGSKTSSTADFIAATRARFAVISVGKTSMFGHPNPNVVERWKRSGAEVWTTGRRGTITFITDGTKMELLGFLP